MRMPNTLLPLAVLALGMAACQSNGKQAPVPAEDPPRPPTIQEFVRQVYFEGVPYDEAAAYGADAVPTLLAMMGDKKEQAAWANVSVTLCIIGDERAVDPLLEFITSGEAAKLSPEVYRAKSGAVMGLGYLVNKSKNQKALEFLIASAEPDAWQKHGLKWSSPYAADRQAQDTQMSSMAILGLALAGTPEAGEALRALKQPGPTPKAVAFRTEVSSTIDQALAEHGAVANEGLSGYYRKRRG